jgi:hypothetical protein
MSASRRRITAALVLGAALVLAGCSSSSTTSQPSAGISAVVSTPPAARHTASAAALAGDLKAAGLPVQQLIVYTATTDPNHLLGRQGGYTSKVAWVDPRAVKAGAGNPASDRGGIEFGGGIEVFPDAASARARYERLRGFQPPFGDGYDYLSGTAILRLSQYLTPAQAHAYRAAFTAAVQQP